MAKCAPAKSTAQGGPAPLTGDDLFKAQASLKEAIRLADDAIYVKLAGQLPTAFQRWLAAGEGSILGLRETQRRIAEGLDEEKFFWEGLKKNLLWPAANQGRIGEGDTNHPINASEVNYLICAAQSVVDRYADRVELADRMSKGKAGLNATVDALRGAAETVGNLNKIVGSVAKTGGAISDWLPWIVGALVLGPFVLRSFAAYRKGGAEGAAEAAASELEAGRAAVGRGARAAWEGGKSLAKRAASGGVLKGAPKRRRKRRPARA